MNNWSSQQYKRAASGNAVSATVLESAVAIGREITRKNRRVQPVFTLKHLAVMSGVPYTLLRSFVGGEKEYTSFSVRKLGPDGRRRHRVVCVPSPALMQVQRWIVRNILAHVVPH